MKFERDKGSFEFHFVCILLEFWVTLLWTTSMVHEKQSVLLWYGLSIINTLSISGYFSKFTLMNKVTIKLIILMFLTPYENKG